MPSKYPFLVVVFPNLNAPINIEIIGIKVIIIFNDLNDIKSK